MEGEADDDGNVSEDDEEQTRGQDVCVVLNKIK
jgi:hypothetical protein